QACAQRGRRASARTLAGSRQRAAGAPRTRLPCRLQPLSPAVEEDPARPLCGARAITGTAHDRRARRGNRTLPAARILDTGRTLREGRTELRRQAVALP